MYTKTTTINPEHIDCQNVLNNIHYSYYFELARHDCLKGFGKSMEDLVEEGIYPVLLDEHIRFKKPIEGGEITITCVFEKISRIKFVALQEILISDKVVSINRCEITCISAKTRRPFFPEYLKDHVQESK